MDLSKRQLNFLVLMRMAIGWHFLYEALLKLFNPGWSSGGYLASAQGPLSGLFQWMSSGAMVDFTDVMSIVLLLAAGLGLLLGFRERIAALAGMFMLAMIYMAHPPFPWLDGGGPSEGNYLFVNKNLVEFFALGVVYYIPTSDHFGLSHLFNRNKS